MKMHPVIGRASVPLRPRPGGAIVNSLFHSASLHGSVIPRVLDSSWEAWHS